jgi:hypothetical protein
LRRALLRRLPALSAYYGLHPWDWEQMTQDEVAEYVVQFDDEMRRRRAPVGGE